MRDVARIGAQLAQARESQPGRVACFPEGEPKDQLRALVMKDTTTMRNQRQEVAAEAIPVRVVAGVEVEAKAALPRIATLGAEVEVVGGVEAKTAGWTWMSFSKINCNRLSWPEEVGLWRIKMSRLRNTDRDWGAHPSKVPGPGLFLWREVPARMRSPIIGVLEAEKNSTLILGHSVTIEEEFSEEEA